MTLYTNYLKSDVTGCLLYGLCNLLHKVESGMHNLVKLLSVF